MTPSRFTYPSPGFEHFWSNGHGKTLLQKLDKTPELAEIEKNIPKLFEFDALADQVIEEVYIKLGYKEADELLGKIISQGIESVSQAPICLKNLFAELDSTPTWLDKEKLKKGTEFCQRGGVFGLMVLRNYSLMGGYESSAINKPLIFTGALKKGAVKRITDTTEFWINITGTDALNRTEIGFSSCVKTRLMHAYARVSILKSAEWENESWGVPLNMWDMVATNLGFSLVYLNGLQTLGFKPTQEEIEAVLHFWKYVGYLLGIPAEYLPDTEKQAIDILYQWTMTQPSADEDTKTLALSLMNEPHSVNFPKRKWQKSFLAQTHLAYNHYFLGERSCQNMNLPKSKFWFLPHIARFINLFNEFFARKSDFFLQRRIRKRRKQQEKIKAMFFRR